MITDEIRASITKRASTDDEWDYVYGKKFIA